jgi:hypothetical protein
MEEFKDMIDFIKKVGSSVQFANPDGYFAFYVPELYFERENAIIIGDYVNLLGILDYAVFDKDNKVILHKPFRFPTVFLSQPSEIEKAKNLKLTKNTDKQDYRVLKYYENDMVVVSTKVPKDTLNIEEFYKLFLWGHLPTTIPYDKMYEYIIDNITLNGGKYSVPYQLIGLITSELCRSPKDLTVPYRLSGSDDPTDYIMVSIKEVPKHISPFTAITSEYFDEGVVSAITMDSDKYSPMETILTR